MTYTLKELDQGAGEPFTVHKLRGFCADELIRTGGKIAGMLYHPFEAFEGDVGACVDAQVFTPFSSSACRTAPHWSHVTRHTSQVRGRAAVRSSVEQYARALRGSLYGGDLEICILVSLFRMTAFLFNFHQWGGTANDKLAPAVHQCSRPNGKFGHLEISLLWEESEAGGGGDHYSLLIPTCASADEFEIDDSDDDVLPENLCVDMSRTGLQPTPPPSPNAILKEVPQRRVRAAAQKTKNKSAAAIPQPPPGPSPSPAASLKIHQLPQGSAPAEDDLTPPPSPAGSLKKRATSAPLARSVRALVMPATTAAPIGKATTLSLLRMQEILDIVGCVPAGDVDVFGAIYAPWYQVHVTRLPSHVTRHTSHVTRHTSHVNTCLLHEQLAQPAALAAHGAYDGLQAFVADFVVGQHENLGQREK